MRDDNDDEEGLVSDEDDDMFDDDDAGEAAVTAAESNLTKLEVRRRLERLNELKRLRQQLGDDWSDDLFDDDL